MDPHSIFCPGFGSVLGMRLRIQEHGNRHKFTNKPGFLPFKKAFVLVPSYRGYVLWPVLPLFKYIFRVIFIFFTLKSDQNPHPDPFVAPGIQIHIAIKSWIQIRIETNADPLFTSLIFGLYTEPDWLLKSSMSLSLTSCYSCDIRFPFTELNFSFSA